MLSLLHQSLRINVKHTHIYTPTTNLHSHGFLEGEGVLRLFGRARIAQNRVPRRFPHEPRRHVHCVPHRSVLLSRGGPLFETKGGKGRMLDGLGGYRAGEHTVWKYFSSGARSCSLYSTFPNLVKSVWKRQVRCGDSLLSKAPMGHRVLQ